KAEWLAQAYEKLTKWLPLIEEEGNFYFVYHGVEDAPMIGVDLNYSGLVPEGLSIVKITPQKFAVVKHGGDIVNQDATFNRICSLDFNQNTNGIHLEMHNKWALKKASSKHFQLTLLILLATQQRHTLLAKGAGQRY